MSHMNIKLRNRPGAALAVVAVSLIGLLAAMTLAIDIGMMYSARNEAQRVADAAALAGASEFLKGTPTVTGATALAHQYVQANHVLNVVVDTSESAVSVDMVNERVRVTVRRRQIPTWFARFIGIDTVAVTATAVAEASPAGGMRCVRPWAVQDMWHEIVNGVEVIPQLTDHFGDSAPDRYQPVDMNNMMDPTATGYGAYAHGPPYPPSGQPDMGKQITLKAQTPQPGGGLAQPGPGEFMIWDQPDDPNMVQCAPQGGQPSSPAFQYRNSICGCNNNVTNVGQQYPLEYGNQVGPSQQGAMALEALDPGATWDPSSNTVVGSTASNWIDSPRIVPFGLIAPLPPPPGQNYTAASLSHITFVGFALFFVEDVQAQGQGLDITGRFIYYGQGLGNPGTSTGLLPKRLRLIE